ncbi:hypothetical protein CAEBREN_03294 [Caenorhabditis brenneri]|uniref:Uncharacterized protein n=1 Tax=Caenorhabditis brenneri TaxID=135651 RepID=G0N7F1_CAEBE|nr:hypothetical protein CAEBREN_03294 [Caenorhabditis brenneri]
MRLFSLHVLVFLVLHCNANGSENSFKATIGLYCPDKMNWEWKVSLVKSSTTDFVAYDTRQGRATEHFQFIQMDSTFVLDPNEIYHPIYVIGHKCKSDGDDKWDELINFSIYADKNSPHIFVAYNLPEFTTNTDAYEKLFVEYLKNECPTGGCSSVREKVDCSRLTAAGAHCKEGLENAMNLITTTTVSSNTTTFIIIGAAVGVVLIIAAFVACFFCKKRSKSGPDPSGMANGAKTESGTTAKTTKTVESQKIEETGSNVTGAKSY